MGELRECLEEIELRLRTKTKAIQELINKHGGAAEKREWSEAIYASAIRAQVALHDPGTKE